MARDVRIERSGNRIWAEIPYDDGEGPLLAKEIDGGRWAKAAKRWTYPLDLAVCRQFREVFGNRLAVGNELADWAREAIAAEQQQLDLRVSTDAELELVPRLAPVLAEAMANRTYQRVGAKFIVNGQAVLIADEPGLGKTLETLAALVETGAKRVLVFAKKKAVENVWGNEAKRWLGDLCEVYPMIGTGAQRQKVIEQFTQDAGTGEWDDYDTPGFADRPMRILIGNIEMVRWPKEGEPKFPDLFNLTWDAVVVDESHKALIGKNVMSKNITQTRHGMMRLPIKADGLRVALSGTPGRGKMRNFWGTLNWLQPSRFSSYWKFARDYFEMTDTGYAIEVGNVRPEMEEAFDKMLAPIMLRRTKEEVAPEMPPRQYGGWPLDPMDPHTTVGVWLPMDRKQAKQYNAIKEDGLAALDNSTITVNGVLAEMTRLRQFSTCSWVQDGWNEKWKTNEHGKKVLVSKLPNYVPVKPSPKFDWLVEFVEERITAGTKVVVASQFTKVVNAFAVWLREAGIESYTITGETSPREVERRVAAFNDPNNDVPVCLINTIAGGESINLDACADDIVFIDETHIPDDQEQAENRIHRMSRMHQVNVWYLRSLGTIEENICRITGEREGAIKARIDGSRGISTLRRMMVGE